MSLLKCSARFDHANHVTNFELETDTGSHLVEVPDGFTTYQALHFLASKLSPPVEVIEPAADTEEKPEEAPSP